MQAVAAEALLPVAPLLAEGGGGPPAAAQVRQLLWDALLELEELSPATASVLALLAAVHTAGTTAAAAAAAPADGSSSLGGLVPRLWPFLRHGLASVRHATLRCLSALLASTPAAALLPGEELQRAARLLFQCLLLERVADVLAAAQAAWQLLVQRAEPAALAAALPSQPILTALFTLAATPAHTALDAALLLTVPPPRKRQAASSKALAGRAASVAALAASNSAAALPAAAATTQQQAERRRESLVLEADGNAEATTRMRLAAAQGLGQLAHSLSGAGGAVNPAAAQAEALLRGGTATGRLLAAFVVTAWAQLAADAGALQPTAADPSLAALLAVLLELLAQPASVAASYAELAQLYGQLRSQASALIGRAVRADVALVMPGPLEALGPTGALAIADQVPAASAWCPGG